MGCQDMSRKREEAECGTRISSRSLIFMLLLSCQTSCTNMSYIFVFVPLVLCYASIASFVFLIFILSPHCHNNVRADDHKSGRKQAAAPKCSFIRRKKEIVVLLSSAQSSFLIPPCNLLNEHVNLRSRTASACITHTLTLSEQRDQLKNMCVIRSSVTTTQILQKENDRM